MDFFLSRRSLYHLHIILYTVHHSELKTNLVYPAFLTMAGLGFSETEHDQNLNDNDEDSDEDDVMFIPSK